MNIYDIMNVKKEEPEIITLDAPIKMIGVSIRTDEKKIFQDSQTLGKAYAKVKKAGVIRNKKEPWAFVAISKDFRPDGSWDYLMGDVVTETAFVPEGLTSFEIPARKYARFILQPRSVLVWGIAMGLLKGYIYAEWLPNSRYEADAGVIGDFEFHDERSKGRKPSIELYVSIRDRQ